jgi:putative addiction module component (TIGR02574 family)
MSFLYTFKRKFAMDVKSLHKYSNAEKILLAEELWDSITKTDMDLPDGTIAELDLRLKKLEEGTTQLYSWQEVKERIKSVR